MTLTQRYGGAEVGANMLLSDPTACLESTPHSVFRGGHSLVPTASDYLRFCQMSLGGAIGREPSPWPEDGGGHQDQSPVAQPAAL